MPGAHPSKVIPTVTLTLRSQGHGWNNVGPTLHKVIQMFCVYWVTIQTWGSSSVQIPAVIQSVCLQVGDQVGAKDKGFELLPHRCRSSIYELAVI